jgi:hypothetical protein
MNDTASLDALRAQLEQQMQAEQGPWRARPSWQRALVTAAPAVLVMVAAGLMLAPVRGWGFSLGAMAAGGLLAVSAFAMATIRPSLSERLAQVSIVVLLVGVVLESWAAHGAGLGPVVPCSSTSSGLALLAAGPTLWWIRSSGFPFRRWHFAALAASVMAMAAVPVWRHCPSTERGHAMLAHGLVPLLAGVVLGYALHAWIHRRR